MIKYEYAFLPPSEFFEDTQVVLKVPFLEFEDPDGTIKCEQHFKMQPEKGKKPIVLILFKDIMRGHEDSMKEYEKLKEGIKWY